MNSKIALIVPALKRKPARDRRSEMRGIHSFGNHFHAVGKMNPSRNSLSDHRSTSSRLRPFAKGRMGLRGLAGLSKNFFDKRRAIVSLTVR